MAATNSNKQQKKRSNIIEETSSVDSKSVYKKYHLHN